MKTEIDMKVYKKRNQYNWFHTFPDPTYGFNVDINIDKVVKICKEKKESFFIAFLYLIIKAVNSVPEMRLREEDGHVYLYDKINPSYTVMSDEGVYQNGGCELADDYQSFYKTVRNSIDSLKKQKVSDELNTDSFSKRTDVIYCSDNPMIDFISMNHPIPAKNYESMSVPRIVIGKYMKKEDGLYHVVVNITVSHTLVDGFPLSDCFNNLRSYCSDASFYLK